MEIGRRIIPTSSRLLVEVDRRERSVGKIVLPAHSQEKLDLVVCKVLARGPGVTAKPWDLGVGDYVLVPRVVLLKYDYTMGRLGKGENSDLAFVWEKDLICTCDPGLVVTGQAQYSEGREGTWSQ